MGARHSRISLAPICQAFQQEARFASFAGIL
jgi:hypothetical protein